MSAEPETRRIEVPRTARYHVLGGGASLHEAWFVLHGYGQLAQPFLASFAALASPERRLVAPEALARFYLKRGTGEIGASWMTREAREDEIADLVRYLDLVAERELGASPSSTIHALGFSQGAPAAARWAVLGKTRVARVTLWSGTFPADLDLERHAERLRSIRWTFVHGKRDEAVDGALVERDVERLRARGIAVELVWFDGGHELEPEALSALAKG